MCTHGHHMTVKESKPVSFITHLTTYVCVTVYWQVLSDVILTIVCEVPVYPSKLEMHN